MKDSKVMGRPREHDREQIADDLIEWAKKGDSINLNKFCALYNPPIWPAKLAMWAKEEENFRIAFETAKAFLGFRREEKLNSEELHVKAYDLNATTYDYFLKDEKRQQAEFESSLKAKETETYTKEDLDKYTSLMNLIEARQSKTVSEE